MKKKYYFVSYWVESGIVGQSGEMQSNVVDAHPFKNEHGNLVSLVSYCEITEEEYKLFLENE